MPLDELNGPSAELLRGARVELSDLHISGLSFDEGHHAGLAVTEHGVGFPVSDAGAVVGSGGSDLDRPLSGQSPSRVVGTVSFASQLGGPAQVLVEGAAASLVGPDMEIDGLMADLEPVYAFQPPGDLLGAPVDLEQLLDQLPVLVGDAVVAP